MEYGIDLIISQNWANGKIQLELLQKQFFSVLRFEGKATIISLYNFNRFGHN
jgi:hypothetical protein